MTRTILFGKNQSSQSKYLLEFKAGKMQMKGNTVTPITKKGLVYLNLAEDNLMHFCWKDRQSGTVEDDLIVFPDDAEFKKISHCKTGRVFVLKFKSSSRRCFYWMQEANEDKDEEICKKVNEYLNHPPLSNSRSSAGGSSGLGSNVSELHENEIQNLIQSVEPQHLVQMLANVNGISNSGVLANFLNQTSSRNRHSASSSLNSTTKSSTKSSVTTSVNNTQETTTTTTTANETPTATATTQALTSSSTAASSSAIQLSDLQNIISGLSMNQVKKDEVSINLASAINSDALKILLENTNFMNKVKELLPNTGELGLPEQSLSEQVTSTIESVQFKSSLNTFNSALQSGLLGPLIQQFNLSAACVEAANKGDLEAFVKALESSLQKKESTSFDKKDTDSDMALE